MTLYDTAVARWLQRNGFAKANPRAALIDMDGTIYDSMPFHEKAWERMADGAGLSYTPGEFFLHEGRTGAATLNILFNRDRGRDATSEEIEYLYGLKTRYFNEMPEVDPVEGVTDVLAIFKAFGLKRVLVTGSGQKSLIVRLNRDFPGIFTDELKVTGPDVVHGKPSPEPFERGMELAAVQPREAIVLENAPLGVEAGAASRAFTIGVTTGPIPQRTLVDAGADVVFSTMKDCAAAMPMILQSLKTVRID